MTPRQNAAKTASILAFLSLFLLACPWARADGPIRVAAIYSTLIEEPWSNCVHKALCDARDRGQITYTYSENVPHSDAIRTLRQYAESGVQLIIGDCYANEIATRAAAREYPNVDFLFASSAAPAEPHFAVFNSFLEESCYLSGMYAGAMTRSGKIGIVGAFPIPQANREMHAFMSGAREMNPRVSFMVTFIGAWFEPAKAKEAALAQIDQGADVFYADRFGVCDAAKERGKLAFGYVNDLQPSFPETLVTSALWNVSPMVEEAVAEIRGGRFRAADFTEYSRMVRGGNDIAPLGTFAGRVPEAVSARVAQKRAAILAGSFRIPEDPSIPKSD